MRKINFKHLIARSVDVGANSVGVNSPWGETGRHSMNVLRNYELISQVSQKFAYGF